ncbi:PIG-L deacetylase family protein [Methylobacterium persicinum]|uniref:LmbE family N-acetylglucosaminyl deacetylase n=1 Tax=Methylobacterium persicinum TaxID=374426 RepID=A0ABU0HNJ5_9HYPH|nr:PIG-L family deacetylase [Methylobacterium persicinum]MDQ0443897.1 LmbE family N-acetylglucosaminyl deacetylase [Methylobacterium persicinum]GJE37588.1 2'-N-acetylparomamine deacetylase [Methylobacterium persicinum]
MPTALALSPHLDDGAFSAGGLLATLASAGWRVVMATVFTQSVAAPEGFALACQLDKGLSPDIDYMALRRVEDDAAAAALGIAAPLHLPFREAPHRGYASAPELFADLRADDSIDRDIAPALGDLLATEAPDLILAPQAVGGHVDHVQMVRALRSLRPGAPILWWRDFPYTVREATPKEPLAGLFADMPLHALSFEGGAQGRKLAACAAYTSQIGFQFGGEAGLAETLAREGGVERYRLSGRLPEPFPARDAS